MVTHSSIAPKLNASFCFCQFSVTTVCFNCKTVNMCLGRE